MQFIITRICLNFFFWISFFFTKLQMSGVNMNILFSDTELKDLT